MQPLHPFIGRQKEIEVLEKAFASEKPELVLLYGRPQLGQTFLIREFVRGKSAVCLNCSLLPENSLLESFSRQLMRISASGSTPAVFDAWHQAFRALAAAKTARKKVLVIEKFEQIENAAALLASAWETILKPAGIMLLLASNDLPFIEKNALSEDGKLADDVTEVLNLKPLTFAQMQQFVPGYSPTEKLAAYAVFGASPVTLRCVTDSVSLRENVLSQVITPYAPLWDAPMTRLQIACREPANYAAILRHAAGGLSKSSEIAAAVGMPPTTITRYIDNLVSMGFLRKQKGLTAGPASGLISHRPRVRITDNYTAFWFSQVLPNYSRVVFGAGEEVWNVRIAPHLDELCTRAFEDLCREFIVRLASDGKQPFPVESIGPIFAKNGKDIFLAAAAAGTEALLVCGAKYSNAPMTAGDYWRLVQKAEHLGIRPSAYYLFSKSGFAPALVLDAKNQDVPVELWSLEDIVQALS